MRGDGRLAASRHAGNQDAGTFEISFALQHGIEIWNAARNTLGRSVMRQPGGRDRHHGDALLIYDERIFVGAVRGTSIFDKPETTGRQLIFDAIIEEDDAVSDVLFSP